MNNILSVTFVSITLLSLLLYYVATGKDKRVLLVTTLWVTVLGIVSFSGYFTNTSTTPPRFLLVLTGSVLLSLFLLKAAKLSELKPRLLLAIHTLRLPVELVLYQLFLQKKVPVLMTFKGWNFDIIVGISAILLLYLSFPKNKLSKRFVLIWNSSGLLFLSIIVVIAILSSPLPLQQLAFDQPNVAVLQFPYIYLPALVVPLVFVSHMLTIKAIRRK